MNTSVSPPALPSATLQKGSWDSIHVFEVRERSRQAHYSLTSTILLYLGSKTIMNEGDGDVSLSGTMTRQVCRVRIRRRSPFRQLISSDYGFATGRARPDGHLPIPARCQHWKDDRGHRVSPSRPSDHVSQAILNTLVPNARQKQTTQFVIGSLLWQDQGHRRRVAIDRGQRDQEPRGQPSERTLGSVWSSSSGRIDSRGD
jgi:hypothetical protein